ELRSSACRTDFAMRILSVPCRRSADPRSRAPCASSAPKVRSAASTQDVMQPGKKPQASRRSSTSRRQHGRIRIRPRVAGSEPEKEWTGTLHFNPTEGNVDHRNEFTPHSTRRRRLPKRSSVATKPAIETKPPYPVLPLSSKHPISTPKSRAREDPRTRAGSQCECRRTLSDRAGLHLPQPRTLLGLQSLLQGICHRQDLCSRRRVRVPQRRGETGRRCLRTRVRVQVPAECTCGPLDS